MQLDPHRSPLVSRALPRAATAAYLVLLALKLWLATQVEPLVDEAFYWQCGQHPAIAYVDHPPLTAMLVRAGGELFGPTTLGVRAFFLLAGAVFPWLVFALARPVLGVRDAWLAFAATLVVPGTAYLGLIAIPDVLILLWTASYLLALQRALQGSRGAWWLAGAAAALGLSTHYRFSVECLAGLGFLLATRAGRAQWKHSGPWIAVAIACTGFAPAVIVNLREGFEPLRYYFEGRHDAQFELERAGKFLGEQLGIAGPLMLFALGAVAWRVAKLARAGDARAQLNLTFALVPVGLFFFASPWESSGLPTLHWPVPGYVPLLPYLPATLRDFAARGTRRWRALAAACVPASGALLVAFMLYELGAGRHALTELAWRHFDGARDAAAKLDPLLAAAAAGGRTPILVVDNYEFGARVAFYVREPAQLYVLDHKANRAHGRARQYVIWRMSERDLLARAGENALVVVQRGADPRHSSWAAHVWSLFEQVEVLEELVAPSPRDQDELRRVRILRGSGIRPAAGS